MLTIESLSMRCATRLSSSLDTGCDALERPAMRSNLEIGPLAADFARAARGNWARFQAAQRNSVSGQ